MDGRRHRRAKNTGHGTRNEQMRRRLRRGCDARTAKAFKRYDGKNKLVACACERIRIMLYYCIAIITHERRVQHTRVLNSQ